MSHSKNVHSYIVLSSRILLEESPYTWEYSFSRTQWEGTFFYEAIMRINMMHILLREYSVISERNTLPFWVLGVLWVVLICFPCNRSGVEFAQGKW